MSGGLNRVTLIGHLGRDPETRQAGSVDVCTMSLATSERVGKDKKEERTEWHRIVVWGASGLACAANLRKGSKVYVEGRIQSRKWTGKDGVEKSTTEIVADRVLFLDWRGDGKADARRPDARREEDFRPGPGSDHARVRGDDRIPF